MLSVVVDNRFASAQRSLEGLSVLDDAKKAAKSAFEYWTRRRHLPSALYACTGKGHGGPIAVAVDSGTGLLRALRGLRPDGSGSLEDAVLSAMGWRGTKEIPESLVILVFTGPTHSFSRSKSWRCVWLTRGMPSSDPGLLCSLKRRHDDSAKTIASDGATLTPLRKEDQEGRALADAARLRFGSDNDPVKAAREMPYDRLDDIYRRANSSFHRKGEPADRHQERSAFRFSDAEYDAWAAVYKQRRAKGEGESRTAKSAGTRQKDQARQRQFLWQGMLAGFCLSSSGDGFSKTEGEEGGEESKFNY